MESNKVLISKWFKNIFNGVFYKKIRLSTENKLNNIKKFKKIKLKKKRLKRAFKKKLIKLPKLISNKKKFFKNQYIFSNILSYKVCILYNGKFLRKIRISKVISNYHAGEFVFTRKPNYYPFRTKKKKLLI